MYIILVIHDDNDVTAVVEWNGSIRIFTKREATEFASRMSAQKKFKYKIVRVV